MLNHKCNSSINRFQIMRLSDNYINKFTFKTEDNYDFNAFFQFVQSIEFWYCFSNLIKHNLVIELNVLHSKINSQKT
jgi:hypothetical protein